MTLLVSVLTAVCVPLSSASYSFQPQYSQYDPSVYSTIYNVCSCGIPLEPVEKVVDRGKIDERVNGK